MQQRRLVELLKEAGAEALFCRAAGVRRAFCGEKVYIRGIIEFSNHCCRSCLYCGLRRENKKVLRYRMLPAEIVNLAGKVAGQGVKTIVLQSGDDFGYSREALAGVIRKIKEVHPQIAVTLSLGERPFDDYRILKEAGADRYLLRHEAANPGLYAYLHPGQTLKTRVDSLEYLKKLGYQVGVGNIVGLPGQTLRDLARDILFIKEMDADMAGVGPFIPQSETPLAGFPPGSPELTLKAMSLVRILTKNIHLPVTTALASLDPVNGLVSGLRAGANVVMPDFTRKDYRKQYRIYDNKVNIDLQTARKAVINSGRELSLEKGDSLKCKERRKAFAYI